MSIKTILEANDAIISNQEPSALRCEYTPVLSIDDRVLQIIDDLKDTIKADTLAVGLAAPQLGYPEAIIVLNMEDIDNIILINPAVELESGQKDTKYESCMSIPHKKGLVERRKKVKVSYFDENFQKREMSQSGFIARVLMHEIDHLNGVLYTDRMEKSVQLEYTDIFEKK